MSMAQQYASYLERESHGAVTPVKAEAMRQAGKTILTLEAERDRAVANMRDVWPVAHRLALELECLLLDTKDMAAVSKWWDSAHDALEQWRELCRQDEEPHNV